MFDHKALGGKLRALRLLRGLTLVDLARKTRMHPPQISVIERGLAHPTLATLNRLATALGVELEVHIT